MCMCAYVCVSCESLIPRASNVTGPRCRPIVLYAMVPGIVSVSYRARVSCVPFVVHRGVYDAASWRYECLEFINGCRANDKSRVRFVSYPRALSIQARKGRKEERGYAATRERLPSTSSYRVHRDPASLTNRLPFLHAQRASSQDGPGIRDRGFLKIVCQFLPPLLPPLHQFLFFSLSVPFLSSYFFFFPFHWFPFIWAEFSDLFNATGVVRNVIRESVCGTSEWYS